MDGEHWSNDTATTLTRRLGLGKQNLKNELLHSMNISCSVVHPVGQPFGGFGGAVSLLVFQYLLRAWTRRQQRGASGNAARCE